MVRADAARNRAAVVTAAARLFRREGPGASLEEIAREAGVGSATLHRHFQGRQALLDAVVLEDVADMSAAADRFEREVAPAEALWHWLAYVASHCARDDALAGLVRTGQIESATQSTSLRMLSDAGAPLLRRAVEVGAARADVQIGDLLRLVNAVAIAAGGSEVTGLLDLIRYGAQGPSA